MKKFSLFLICALVLMGGFISTPKADAAGISSITVVSPNGGEKWSGIHDITWTSATTTEVGVDIYYCPTGVCGDSATLIVASTTNDGLYSWDTTTAGGDAATYKIKIIETGGGVTTDTSNTTFIVDNTVPAPFTLGTVVATGGTVISDKWNSTNTGVSLSVPIANDSSLVGGHIQVQASSTDWENVGATSSISVANTTQEVTLTAGQLEGIVGFAEDGNVSFRSIITDYAGNYTTSTASTNIFTVDQTLPTVTVANSDKTNGSYKQGDVIDIDLTFSEVVTSSGNVTVTLDTTGSCTFSISASTTGTCDYIIGAGETSADLTVSSVTGTITDTAGNAVAVPATPTSNLAANKALVVDTTAPTVSSADITTADGSYKAGQNIDITVTYDQAVTVTGSPQIALNVVGDAQRYAIYNSGSPGTDIVFRYTVQANDNIIDLGASSTVALELSGGTIQDAALNNAVNTLPDDLTGANAVVVDTSSPSAPVFTSIATDNYISDAEKATVAVVGTAEADSTVTVTLYDAGNANSVSGTAVATSSVYTVTLDVTSLVDGVGTITASSTATDAAGNISSEATTTATKDVVAPTATAVISPNTGYAKVGTITTTTLTAGGSQADLTLGGACTVNTVDVSGTFVNNADGTYTLTYTVAEGHTDRTSGNLPISCVLREPAGNTVTVSTYTGNTLVVDANTPSAPVITSIATDNYINNSEKGAIHVVGTAEADATIDVSLTSGATVIGSGTATGGNYDITIDGTTLTDGTVTPSVTATDAAGNVSSAATTPTATKDVVAPTLPVTGIVGTTVQGSGDTITFTFDSVVQPADGTWSSNEFTSIKSPSGTTLTLTNATFSPTSGATTTLTVTLNEATDTAFLRNGNVVLATPASNKIQDVAGNYVVNSEITGTTANSGDAVQPTVALTYSPDRTVTPFETIRITATFSEAVYETTVPTIAIATPGDGDLVATNMTKTSSTEWYYDWSVPGNTDEQGIATSTIVATDLAGNTNEVATNSTRTIDSIAPVVNAFTATSLTTSTALLTVTTNEAATCKYANTELDYASMATMATTTGVTTHYQSLTGLSANTRYDYYVRCADSNSNTMGYSAHVSFTTSINDSAGLAVTQISASSTYATADSTYTNGWSWVFKITVPTSETSLKLKFANWTSGANSILATDNIRYYSSQSSDVYSTSTAVSITAAGTYPDTAMTLDSDLDATTAGRQIEVVVEARVPTGSSGGSYSTSYGVQSQ